MSATEQQAPIAAENEPPVRFRFRLVHVVYVITLLGASLATFGLNGIWAFVAVSLLWAAIFASKARVITVVELATILVMCAMLGALALPAVNVTVPASPRMACSNNLKQIALALHNYHDDHGSFPPAYIADENGKPMHSWRVLLLPYLEQAPLYQRYKFDEPWDGPNNSKLLNQSPSIYACPSHSQANPLGNTHTSYFAVVGSKTAWPGVDASRLDDLTDGTANTVLLLEVQNQNIPWLKPDDLALDEALNVLTAKDLTKTGAHKYETAYYRYWWGRNVAWADGSVHFIGNDVDRAAWSVLLTTGEKSSREDQYLDRYRAKSRRLKVGNQLALAIWYVVFPLSWIWIKPKAAIE